MQKPVDLITRCKMTTGVYFQTSASIQPRTSGCFEVQPRNWNLSRLQGRPPRASSSANRSTGSSWSSPAITGTSQVSNNPLAQSEIPCWARGRVVQKLDFRKSQDTKFIEIIPKAAIRSLFRGNKPTKEMRYGQKSTRLDLNFFNRYDSIFTLEVVVVFHIINPKLVEKNITVSEIVETMSFTIFFTL